MHMASLGRVISSYVKFRWFRECGVSIASEKVMRKRAVEVIGENPVVVEKVAFTFKTKEKGSIEVKLKPFGYIPDLWAKLLEQNLE